MRIVGYHIQDDTIADSEGNLCCQPPYLEWLLQPKGDCIRVFYHLDYSVACLLTTIGLDSWELKKLVEKGQIWRSGYKINYIPHKWFGIKNNNNYAGFSDMAQYIDWNLDYHDNPKLKAKMAAETGEIVYDTLLKANIKAKSLTSPVGAFEKSVMADMNLPTCVDIPDEVNKIAYECCHGSWLEVFKKGHFDCYDYDISGAYPFFTRSLLDTRFGEWKQNSQYVPEAKYGYCKGTVTIDKTPSPIIYAARKDMNYHPVGQWEAGLTKGEIDFITQYGIGTFEITDGYWWIPEAEIYPMQKTIDSLYELRETLTGLEREVIKRITTGIWGKFGEIWHDGTLGNYFNPVWMAEVEASTRIEVARFIYDNDLSSSLLSIAVDGIVSSADSVHCNQNGMGRWRLNAHCPGFVISSGIVSLKDSKSNKDFSLRYDWLQDQIADNPYISEYSMTKMSPVSIGKGVNQRRYADIGKLEQITKYVDVSYEMKRDYPVLPLNGKELLENKYESFAFDVSRLQIEEIKDGNESVMSDSGLSDMPVLER